MDNGGFSGVEQAGDLLDRALSALSDVRDGNFWKLGREEILEVGRRLETVARVAYAAQVRLAGEIDEQGFASVLSCSSTPALLRQAFNISAADARNRVRAARETITQAATAGGELPARLPVLAQVLDSGSLGPEHIRTIVDTMAKLPTGLTEEGRGLAERLLVDNALVCDPTHFVDAARAIAEILDPDGKLDDTPPARKTEFSIGQRSASTGLTPIKGLLDDLSVEILRKAVDPLAAPQPETNGVKDLRSAANRRAHALIEALHRYLNAGIGPSQGGEPAHVTVTMEYDALREKLKSGTFDSGHLATPHTVRRLLCDAKLLPAVLGGDGQVLSVGRAQRTFPAHIRKAITIRDQGCTWPGCDRPPGWCEAHHTRWWQRDFGETSYANGTLLCSYHHGEIHSGPWEIRIASDGIPEFVPPAWIDPKRKPRRNKLHRLPRSDPEPAARKLQG
jgi:hypothetical protein